MTQARLCQREIHLDVLRVYQVGHQAVLLLLTVGEAFELDSLDCHWGVLLLAGLLLLLDLHLLLCWARCRLDNLGHLLLTQCSDCWILKADLRAGSWAWRLRKSI